MLTEVIDVASTKQRQAAKRNIRKAITASKRKRSIASMAAGAGRPVRYPALETRESPAGPNRLKSPGFDVASAAPARSAVAATMQSTSEARRLP